MGEETKPCLNIFKADFESTVEDFIETFKDMKLEYNKIWATKKKGCYKITFPSRDAAINFIKVNPVVSLSLFKHLLANPR